LGSADGRIAKVGITDYAQQEMNDVVFVKLPDLGDMERASPVGVLESVISARDLYTPVSGEIIEVNLDLMADPLKLNHDSYDYDTGRICTLRVDDSSKYESFMDSMSDIRYFHS
jgi:glycine cleavage system H protein